MPARRAPAKWRRRRAPERLIENGIPTEALVAHVLIAKYADHTPIYRQGKSMCAKVSRSIVPGRLGGLRSFHAAAGAYTPAGTTEAIDQAVCRRDDGAGARSRAR